MFNSLQIHEKYLERMNGMTNQLVQANISRFIPSQANQSKHYNFGQKPNFSHSNNTNNVPNNSHGKSSNNQDHGNFMNGSKYKGIC